MSSKYTNFAKIRVTKIAGLKNIENSDKYISYQLKYENTSISFKEEEAESLNFIIKLDSNDLSSFKIELLANDSESIQSIGFINGSDLSIQDQREISVQQVQFNMPNFPSTEPVTSILIINNPSEKIRFKKLTEFSNSDFDFENSQTILENEFFTLLSALHIEKNKRYLIKKYKLDDINGLQNSTPTKKLTVDDITKVYNTKSYDTLLPISGFIRFQSEEEEKHESELESLISPQIEVVERTAKVLNSEGNQKFVFVEGSTTIDDYDPNEGHPDWRITKLNEEENPIWAILEGHETVEDDENDTKNEKPVLKLNEEDNPIWAILEGHESVEDDEVDENDVRTRTILDLADDENSKMTVIGQNIDNGLVSCIVYNEMTSSSNSSIMSLEDIIHNPTKDVKYISNNNKTKIMYQITHALNRLHYQGEAHRHLNPKNILVNTKTFTVKLFDYEVSNEIIGKDLHNIYYKQENQYKEESNSENSDDLEKIRLDLASDIFALGMIYFEISSGRKKERESDNNDDLIYISTNLRFMIEKMIDSNPQNRPYIEEVLQLFETVNFGIYDTKKEKIIGFIDKYKESNPRGLGFLMQLDEEQFEKEGNCANLYGLFAFKKINDQLIKVDKFVQYCEQQQDGLFLPSLLGQLALKKEVEFDDDDSEKFSGLIEKAYNNKESKPDFHFCLFDLDDDDENVENFTLWWQYQQIRTGMKDAKIYFSDFSKHKIDDNYIDKYNKIVQLHRDDTENNPYVKFSLAMLLYKNKLNKEHNKNEIKDLIGEGVNSYVTRSLTNTFLHPTEDHINEKTIGATHNSTEIIEELTAYYFNANDAVNSKKYARLGAANKDGYCEYVMSELYKNKDDDDRAQKYQQRSIKHGQQMTFDVFEEEEEEIEVEQKKNKFDYNSDDDSNNGNSNKDQRFGYVSDDIIEEEEEVDDDSERRREEEEEEAERRRKEEEEAERIRKEEEEAERIRKEEEEAERIRKEEEEEAERLRKEKEEAERIRKEEEEAERRRKEEEEAERIRKEEEEAERLRKEKEEAERIRKEEEHRAQEKGILSRHITIQQETDTNKTFDDTIESYISQRDAPNLIRYLQSLHDHDLTNSVFDRLYQTDRAFYSSLIESGIEINEPVSLHKKALTLLLSPENDKDESILKTNYKEARTLLQSSINLGFSLSYFTLSRLLHEYYHKDNEAFKLAREGTARKEKYSTALLGHYLSRGIGIRKYFDRGILIMLNSGAEDYYERFSTDIGIYYARKSNLENAEESDKENAFKWFERAYSLQKTKASINNYGVCYMLGFGTDKDMEKAKEIYKDGAYNCNDANSLYHLGSIYEEREEYEKSFPLFKEAAEKGITNAQAHYAYLLTESGTQEGYNDCKKYFKAAADKGHVISNASYAFIIEEDESDNSLGYYRRAADRGNADAQVFLALKYSKENDPENTFKYMKMCIQSGKHMVPLEYAKKLHEEQKYKLAFTYFDLVSQTNNPAALFFKGVMLFRGEGCNENKEESYKIMKNLADKNVHAAAEFIEDYFRE